MKNLFIICACALTIWSCSNEPDGDQKKGGAISVDTEMVSFLNNGTPSEAGADQVTVTASGEWRLSGPQDWCTPSAVSGKDGAKVTFTAAANPSGEPRVATFAFINGDKTAKVIVQQNEGNVFAISQTTFNVLAGGEKIKISVLKNVNVTYSIPETDTWITDVTDPAANAGKDAKDPMYLNFQVAANATGVSRPGKIVFVDPTTSIKQEVIINQLPVVATTPPASTALVVVPAGEDVTVDFVSNVPLVAIPLAVDAAWITSVSSEPGKLKLRFARAENGRSSSIVFKTPTGSTAFTMTVTQNGANPVIAPIPDGAFRTQLLRDGYIMANADTYEITAKGLAITDLTYTSKSFTSVQGIEFFTKLKTINFSSNNIVELDLSKNIAATSINCSTNKLTSLKVSGLAKLVTLNSSKNNALTALDLSGCTQLSSLVTSGCKLDALDLKDNSLLKTVDCASNALTELNISNLTGLTSLVCTANKLTSLGLLNNRALTSLTCDNNLIARLDVSNLSELVSLNCSANKLAGGVDLSRNFKITTYNCVTNGILDLDISSNVLLKTLSAGNNILEKINLGASAVTSLTFNGFATTELLGVNPVIRGDKITSITLSSCSNVVTIDVSGCPSLTTLSVDNGNSKLVTIYKKAGQTITIRKSATATIVEK